MADFGGFFLLGSKNNRNCPPLSALSIHHDTPRLHQQAFLPPMARTHANALATEVMQHGMAQRHQLSKALAVSLLKNHYFNEGFCRGKGRPFDLEVFCIFDTSLINAFTKNVPGLLFGFETLSR